MRTHFIRTSENTKTYSMKEHDSSRAKELLKELENLPDKQFITLTKSRAIKAIQNNERIKEVMCFGKAIPAPHNAAIASFIGMCVKF